MKNKTGQLLIHIIGCIAFLSLPVLLSPDVSWNFRFLQLRPFQEDFVSYTLILLFFYLNYFMLLPKLYFKEQYFFYFASVAASYLLVAMLPDLLIPGNHMHGMRPPSDLFTNSQPPVPSPHPGAGPGMPRFQHLFQFSIVLILSAIIRLNNRLRQTEKEKVNAELSYLKAQINPHFLFNTLNSIYSSAIQENADNTATAVVKLSGMMRYVISEAHNDFVSLEKEINYISDYIELQKIRLGDTVQVKYHVTGASAGKKIAPLVLISFIENAFKHGVNPEQSSVIAIEIAVAEDILQLMVSNSKVSTVNAGTIKHNIGLVNTRNRLQLLYPSKHELQINDNEKEYAVLLKINLA